MTWAGTNTDAVLIDDKLNVVADIKYPTSKDIYDGILGAVRTVLDSSGVNPEGDHPSYAGHHPMHKRHRRAETSGEDRHYPHWRPRHPPVFPLWWTGQQTFSKLLHDAIIIGGGYEYDGKEIAPLDEEAARGFLERVRGKVHSIAISCVFSTIREDHERRIAPSVGKCWGEDIHTSISCEIGSMGLIERENATILNAALYQVAERFTDGFARSLADEGVTNAEIYLSQNDGTLMTMEHARKYPILTIACGPTNSIRGASYLSKIRQCHCH